MKSLFFNYNRIYDLEMEYGSSFYLLHVNKLRDNYKKIENAFKSRYENFLIGYSYKTNYLPYLCKEIDKLGGYAEVVSRLEYDLALKIGVKANKIIFNGPVKTFDDIETALKSGSILNIDSMYEVDYVERICLEHQGIQFKIGIRVNFNLTKDGENLLQEGYEASRFGICEENGDLSYAIKRLKNIKNLSIIGLHSHFSTKNREISSYKKTTKFLCNIAKEQLIDTVEYIDIGGGIYGEIPESFQIDAPTFDDYAEAICGIMNEEFALFKKKPFLVLEPGMSMVANTIFFIAKVVEVKQIRELNFVFVDGSVHNIKPTMHKRNLPIQHVKGNHLSADKGLYHIVGYTCMEKDYLAHDIAGDLPKKNDYFIFENVGAYTIVFNPPFIKERPSIVALDGNQTFAVRKKETIKEFFNEDIYSF
ncbi:type III PLP-dependent enzyme domain-containing protein [Cytobacillus massiliigabonensis]|uniref:diaminopimelate decarboxylase n=1 Tax=Cytobacillus massiliigabonensis TaxID=1871011 RepID=UPI003898DACA